MRYTIQGGNPNGPGYVNIHGKGGVAIISDDKYLFIQMDGAVEQVALTHNGPLSFETWEAA